MTAWRLISGAISAAQRLIAGKNEWRIAYLAEPLGVKGAEPPCGDRPARSGRGGAGAVPLLENF